MIYFDNSATTYPKPPEVADAVRDGVLRYGGNPGRGGHDIAVRVSDMVFAVRLKLSEWFGVQPERVMFTENCTMSLNTAIAAIPDGADVLTTDLEHNAVIRPLEAARKRGRLHYRVVPAGEKETFVQRMESLLRPDTKAVVMTAASNVTGEILPVRAVGALCRRYGLIYIVDAAQASGVIPLNCQTDNIDFLCMSAHKGLYGITGTGMLLSSGRVPLVPLLYGGTGTDSLSVGQPNILPEALEAGTIPTVGICALGAGMDFIARQDMRSLTEHSLRLCRMLYDARAAMPQIKLYSPRPSWGRTVPIVAFLLRGQSSEVTAEALNDCGFALRGGFQCAAVTHRQAAYDGYRRGAFFARLL